MKRVLLTNVRPDLIEGGYVASLFDPFGERFTRGQGVFTMTGHLHALGTHMIAQNIQTPSLVLEYPTLDDFRNELRKGKGYDVIGISFWINHTDGALEMCRAAREASPSSTIVLGGHGVLNLYDAVPDESERKALFDHVCPGEGVGFMRELLGEVVDTPVKQGIFPRNGAGPPWFSPNPPGTIASILAGYGCEMACSFCASSRFWDHRHIEFTDAAGIYRSVQRLFEIYPDLFSFLIVDEDFFRLKKVVRELRALLAGDTTFGGLARFSFITETSIGALSQYDPDDILASGLEYAFIGYESKFAAEHGLHKRKGDAKEVFDNLRLRGINTNSAMMVGWDFQTPENLQEDLDYLISCQPTQSQFSRLIPYPGTRLWKQLKEEGRLDLSVPWKEYHNYGGSYRHEHLSAAQIIDFIERAHVTTYEQLGPSLFRMFQTYLNGYEHCLSSKRPELRRQKAGHFRERLQAAHTIFEVCRRFAPNDRVRGMAEHADSRLADCLGPPSQEVVAATDTVLGLVEAFAAEQAARPGPPPPRTYPCKRYIYDGKGDGSGRPFRVEYDN
jgi:radical SAM superfamily enzyme YgiQ (UPF0313 family)